MENRTPFGESPLRQSQFSIHLRGVYVDSSQQYPYLIDDDASDFINPCIDNLKLLQELESFEFQVLNQEEFLGSLLILEDRRQRARKGPVAFDAEKCRIDEADILIVDFDLIKFEGDGDHFSGMPTGERIAYLARCYSQCGLIVTLNQFGTNRFDLTLKGAPWSFADINLGSEQISNPTLWRDGKREGFSPWSWLLLPQAAEALEKRVQYLLSENDGQKVIGTSILEDLGFDSAHVGHLPRTVLEFLSQSKEEPYDLTFAEFVLGGSCLRPKDVPPNDEAVARIAAARVQKWIERVVRPGQDILVDAPHMITRFPSLLQGTDWDLTAATTRLDELPINKDIIEDFRFTEMWSPRPLWFWEQLKGFEGIEEIKDPFRVDKRSEFLGLVFCEDLSRFISKDKSREFVADLPSPFVRRFVVDPSSDEGKEVAKVDYAPAVRFAM